MVTRFRRTPAKSTSTALFVVVALGVAILRLYYCLQLPANTGDVLRHLSWGYVVNMRGYAVVDLPLSDINPKLAQVSWSSLPYNYPPLALVFDQLVAAISPTIFSMKLTLTVLEAVSAILIYLYSREKWLALVYWASPISIWWISREGQFESLHNLFAIASVYFLSRKPRLAWLSLAFAIQVKLFAISLVPLFLLSSRRGKAMALNLVAFVSGFAPTAVALLLFSPLRNMRYSAALDYNPYYFNPLDTDIFRWNPPWLITANQLATYVAVILFLYLLWTSPSKVQFLAPLGFLLAVKVLPNAQFWYMVVLPALLLPIQNKRLRLAFFLYVSLLDLRPILQMLYGPLGNVVEGYYQSISIFTHISSLF